MNKEAIKAFDELADRYDSWLIAMRQLLNLN